MTKATSLNTILMCREFSYYYVNGICLKLFMPNMGNIYIRMVDIMDKPDKIRQRLNSFQIIVLGFACVILVGALLLMLPISSVSGQVTPFLDSLFTSTTSVCVTGLVVQDTGTYWSLFGQIIILILVQIGGLGVVTVVTCLAILGGRKIGLFQRSIMQEAVAAPHVGGIVELTGFILKTTFLIELLGAVALAPVFCKDFGIAKGIWMAVFHSISAFCNAGLDLMGSTEKYSSLTSYIQNPVINIVIMSLIIVGGIGFITWNDVRTHKFRLKNYRMQSKVILAVTAALVLVPAIAFFFMEFQDMPMKQRVFSSLFQAITPRTAGFNTADLTQMSEAGQLSIIGLMMIGGSPGSTAGGMKTTTFAVIIGCGIAVFRRRDSVHFFGRRVPDDTISIALTLFFMYISLPVVSAIIMSRIEALPIMTCLFETVSAMATVGLTLGITPGLTIVSRIILILLMFLGRVGGLTLVYAAVSSTKVQMGRFPQDKMTVG